MYELHFFLRLNPIVLVELVLLLSYCNSDGSQIASYRLVLTHSKHVTLRQTSWWSHRAEVTAVLHFMMTRLLHRFEL